MTYLFIDNKYSKIYFQIIDKRKNSVLSKKDVYCERHHIIPKSKGGTGDSTRPKNNPCPTNLTQQI